MISTVIEKLNRESTIWRARFFDNPVEHHGVYLDINKPQFDQTARYWVINGWFEMEELALITDYIDPTVPVIELGGGYGFISCQLSNLIANDTSQVTVEANPDLIDIIKHHRGINNCDFNIINKVYSPTRDQAKLYLQDKADGSSIREVRSSDDYVEVEAITLKDLLNYEQCSEFQLVADIEGAEFQLIDSELDLLRNHCVTIIMEIHDYTEDSRKDAISRMTGAEFEIVDTDGETVAFKNTNL